ncbi:MAG: hypothetical protein HY812_14540 [Planctomycetes bacterium]|nr:hypothetical protein [Planctomycetota bacterium]
MPRDPSGPRKQAERLRRDREDQSKIPGGPARTATAAAAFLASVLLAGCGLFERETARDDAASAERRAEEAERQRQLLLSDVEALADLKARMKELWPAHPDKIAAMEEWLGEARGVAGRLAQHQATLAELRSRGTPAPHARDAKLAALKTETAELSQKLQVPAEGDDRETLERLLAYRKTRIAALEAEIERTRPHDFPSSADVWWHDTLVALVSDLSAFLADDAHQQTVKSVEERLAFARAIEARSILNERAAWDQAVASIANSDECPKYNGLTITP